VPRLIIIYTLKINTAFTLKDITARQAPVAPNKIFRISFTQVIDFLLEILQKHHADELTFRGNESTNGRR